MKTDYLQTMDVPDGYFGERSILHLCYDPESLTTLAVTPQGYFRVGTLAASKEEAAWMLSHHPKFRNYRLI